MKPSYEELESTLTDTEAKLEQTQSLLKIAIDRIAVLEERLNKNSNNSSKPSSTDRKPNSPNRNGQRKHRSKGYNRPSFPPERVDQFITCFLENCPHCGSNQLIEEGNHLVLQQVDLPEVKAIVTQFNCTNHK